MNLIIIRPEELVLPAGTCHGGGSAFAVAELSGKRYDHLLEVLKIDQRSGMCKIGMLDGLAGTGECVGIDREAKKIRLKVTFDRQPPAPLPVTLAAALPRPKTFRKVLHAAVSMGVKKLHFFGSFKVEKSYWQSPLIAEAAWREESVLALEQSCDTVMPEVAFHRFFKPFAEDILPEISAGTQLFTAHPAGEMLCPADVQTPVTLCVGPEGGFTDYELDLLKKAGSRVITLGSHILRTEVAIPALLGRIAGAML